MRLRALLFVMFAVVPVAEIALLVFVGQRIGLAATLLIVVLTAVVGSAVVARQGKGQVRQVREAIDAGGFPGRELAHGALILVAGVLLLTPGFMTDAIGFLLLVPSVREVLRSWGARRLRRRTMIL